MQVDPLKQSVSPKLLRLAVAQQLSEDDSPEARDFRHRLQSESFYGMGGSSELENHRRLICDLRRMALREPSGSDVALRQNLAASAEAGFAAAGVAAPPVGYRCFGASGIPSPHVVRRYNSQIWR